MTCTNRLQDAPNHLMDILAPLNRRQFVKNLTIAGSAVAAGLNHVSAAADAATTRMNVKLGLDNFAVRALGWKAPQLIDYAASLKTDSLFITDLGPFYSR